MECFDSRLCKRLNPGVAQSGSAQVLGTWGRVFESRLPDQFEVNMRKSEETLIEIMYKDMLGMVSKKELQDIINQEKRRGVFDLDVALKNFAPNVEFTEPKSFGSLIKK